MQNTDPPEQAPEPVSAEADPLARFRSWRGFLVAAIAVNVLFVFTMLGHNDTGVAIWHKVLIWLPFNAIATAVYLAIMSRLSTPAEPEATSRKATGMFYTLLCAALIIANWTLMFAA